MTNKEKNLNDLLDLWREHKENYSVGLDFSKDDSHIFLTLRDKKGEIKFATICRTYNELINRLEEFLNASGIMHIDWKDSHVPKEYRDGQGY